MALSPELKRMVRGANARHARHGRSTEKQAEFDRRQVALLLKAVELAAKSAPELAHDFKYAVGYAAGCVNLGAPEFEEAKALALTL